MEPEDSLMEPEDVVVEAEDVVVEAAEAPVEPARVEDEPGLEAVQAIVPALGEVSLEPLGGDGVTELGNDGDLSRVLEVPVELTVEMGRTTMTIRETLAITNGTIVTLNRLVGEPVDLFANGRLIARGEVIAVDEEYGLRVTEVLARSQQKAA
jgi:flagellar motor switch protein FliN/FliY